MTRVLMRSRGRCRDMKRVLIPILMSVAILLAISSCATVRKGELRLLSMEVPESERLRTNVQFWVRINFEADGNPEISRACFFWSGDGPYCFNVRDVKYGSLAYFQVPLLARLGSDSLQCYVEYVRDGKIQRSNAIASFITGVMR
jgi:hypothetical protein